MSSSVAIPTLAGPAPAGKAGTFQAGVRSYASDYHVPDYVPADTDLLCAFRIQPSSGVDMVEAAAAVAAESSTGTWTEVWSNQLTDINYYKAKVYRIDGDIASIAHPMDPTWPVASGGIHVGNIPDLYALYGNDAFWLVGGGTHGHPKGSRAGARANRVATEAVAAGRTLKEAAQTCPELREAMALWGHVEFGVSE
jgi:ribulose 1,5-bisphosphate carboxylase large subunit-like protein